MGKGSAAAIWLNDELSAGYSCECDTFASPPLIGDEGGGGGSDKASRDFKCVAVELYVFA